MRERKNLMSVGQVAEIFGVTAATVRRWCREGKLKEYLRTVGNHRRFREEDYRHLLPAEERGRKTVGYARVSSHDQKNDLQTQAERLRDYGCDEVIMDLGSGLNSKKPGLRKLMRLLLGGQIRTLVLTHDDRLLRFGTELIYILCRWVKTSVVVLDDSAKEPFETELVKDVITLMTVFSARLYGKRSWKNRKSVELPLKCNRILSA